MSRGTSAKPGTEPPKTVALPVLPKFDEKIERKKWAGDYDKVEVDLLRNYLGAESVTLGLRAAGAVLEFDRRLPALDEPTEADRLEALKLTMKRPNRGGVSMQQRAPEPSSHQPRSSTAMASLGGSFSPHQADRSSTTVSPARRQRVLSPTNVTRSMSAMEHSTGPARSSTSLANISKISVENNNTTIISQSSCGEHHGDPLKSLPKCVRILETLLQPPPEFKDSFLLSLEGVDLSWVWQYTADRMPQQLLTLDTLKENATTTPGCRLRDVVLNSPRSTVIMLRNGVTCRDLIQLPRSHFYTGSISDESAETAYTHYEARRKAMLGSLRQEYRVVCGGVALHELIQALQQRHRAHTSGTRASPRRGRHSDSAAVSAPRNRSPSPQKSAVGVTLDDDDAAAALSGFAAQRREKMERLAAKSKEKLRKQVEAIEALKREMEEAERKRAESNHSLLEREADRKRALEERSAGAAKHFNEMRDKATLFNMSYLAKMEERRKKLEEKASQKREQLRAAEEARRAEAEAAAKAKEDRLKANRETLSSMKEQELLKQAEKESNAREKRELQERRKAEERHAAAERAAKQIAQRKEAVERAKKLKEDAIRQAIAREQLADERLAQFQEAQRRAREAAAEAEREKEQRRQHAIQAAENHIVSRVHQIEEKRSLHDRFLNEVHRAKTEEERRRHDYERLAASDKKFLVERQSKANEFKKLLRAVSMLEKQDQSLDIAHQKKLISDVMAREREAMRLEKEAAAAKLSKLL